MRSLGLTGCYQGYSCLIYAALLVHQDPSTLEMPTKLLYPEVARQCHLTPGGVDQAIRTAIQVCCRCDLNRVAHLCGTTCLPTAQQFLTALVDSCIGRQR